MTCFAKFLAARLRSIGFALAGLAYVLQTQGHARIHLFATVWVIGFGFGFRVSRLEWVALLVALALVWVAEIMNTALEMLCDFVEPERSDAIRRSKDAAAGAVLVAALVAVGIGGLTFWPYIFS